MYSLPFGLILPTVAALTVVKIHPYSFYFPLSPCAYSRNAAYSESASIQSCIWECARDSDCQTAVYFNEEKICSLFAEFWTTGSIQSSGEVRASVICHRKEHGELAIGIHTSEKSSFSPWTFVLVQYESKTRRGIYHSPWHDNTRQAKYVQ